MAIISMSRQNISLTNRNTEIPFYPSVTYQLFQSDFGNITVPTFFWIQAFYNSSLISVVPSLVLYSGNDANGKPIYSLVQFGYSGERINIKAQGIIASGFDIRGNAISSTPIGTDPAANLSTVIAYGGMY